jgi:UDP-glucose 4-epimerase
MAEPRTATVVGAAGFIGRHLAQQLRQEGWRVQEIGRGEAGLPDSPLGHVFYCAGLTANYAQRPHDTVQAHVSLLSQLLQRAQFESLVYLSSTRLYDDAVVDTVDETTPLALDPRQPRHLFDLSKALGESLCHATGPGRARVARLSCVLKDAGDADGFLPQLLRGVAQVAAMADPGLAPQLRVDSTPHAARDYVLLDDVLSALQLIATRGTQSLYNVASGRNLSNHELFARLRELSGCEIVPTRQAMVPPSPRIDISRMQREFGWQPACLLDRLARMLPEPLPC